METIKIKPSPLSGRVNIPPSKSAAHRNIICAALSQGRSVISPVCHSEDIDATISACKALGAVITEEDNAFIIEGIDKSNLVGKRVTIDCRESGSTLRFMIPIAAALGVKATFIGHGRLPNRPITPITEAISNKGVVCSGDSLPLTVSGKLLNGEYLISGDVSSQYLTGLLFAIGLNGGTVRLTTPLESAGYVKLTIEILKCFGVAVYEKNGVYSAKGQFSPTNAKIEGDWSQACFYLAAGALGGELELSGLNFNSSQGDIKAIELFKGFGANITVKDNILYVKSGELKGQNIDCSQIPDMVPALAVTAALSQGKTTIFGGSRLRLKETDRIKTVIAGLAAMGITATETPDGMIITGGKPTGGTVDGSGDHRIVMAFSILAAFCDDSTKINGYTSVNKSYPNFFEDFKSIGGRADGIISWR